MRTFHDGHDTTGAIIAVALVVLDQFIKHLIDRLHAPVAVAGISVGKVINNVGVFSISVTNDALVAANMAVCLVLVLLLVRRPMRPPARFGVWLMLGGSFSNLLDRLQQGGVIDIIAFWGGPRFNLADVMIVLGALSVVRSVWWERKA